jgi:hypothetical protein
MTLCVECRWFGNWQDILERLFLCLEYVSLAPPAAKAVPPSERGALVRGNSMQGEYVDDVLNFFVSYDVFVYYGEEEKEKMEKLTMREEFLWH